MDSSRGPFPTPEGPTVIVSSDRCDVHDDNENDIVAVVVSVVLWAPTQRFRPGDIRTPSPFTSHWVFKLNRKPTDYHSSVSTQRGTPLDVSHFGLRSTCVTSNYLRYLRLRLFFPSFGSYGFRVRSLSHRLPKFMSNRPFSVIFTTKISLSIPRVKTRREVFVKVSLNELSSEHRRNMRVVSRTLSLPRLSTYNLVNCLSSRKGDIK